MNFVVVLVDDLGWNDLACYGSKFHETPNLDAFAKTGVQFTQAYAAGSVCSPTRAALMTGLYPSRVNITDWIAGRGDKNQPLATPKIDNQLALKQETLAEILKSQGYKTCFAGKWHLGSRGFYPQDQGFDSNFGGHERGSPPGGYYSPYQNPQLKDGPEGEYLPDRLTDESIEFIKKNKDEPFFMMLSFYTVHTPIQPCKRHLEKFQTKRIRMFGEAQTSDSEFQTEHNGFTRSRQDNPRYASMVYAMDENVGRLLQAIDDLGLDENTTIIFTSDNGGLSTLPNKRAPTSVSPLRAGKGWLYEGGIRIPLIIRTPNAKANANRCEEPVITMDVFQTVCDLAGSKHVTTDGISLAGLCNDTTAGLNRSSLYWHYPHYHGSAWTPGAAIRHGKWKLIEFYETGVKELYDLESDEHESQDLSEQKKQICAELSIELSAWQKSTNAKLPVRR